MLSCQSVQAAGMWLGSPRAVSERPVNIPAGVWALYTVELNHSLVHHGVGTDAGVGAPKAGVGALCRVVTLDYEFAKNFR